MIAIDSQPPQPTVLATPVPTTNTAMKLNVAAHRTALWGVKTRVATTVAMEFAASWNPLMKSSVSATSTMTPTRISECPMPL